MIQSILFETSEITIAASVLATMLHAFRWDAQCQTILILHAL